MIPMPGVKHPRGTQVRLELIGWDELDLTVQARVLEVSSAGADNVDDMSDESALPETELSASSDDAPSSDASAPAQTTEPAEAAGPSDAAAASEPEATSPPRPA